jgi:NAD-dependent SIR2 family protein deacetylase
MTHFPAIRVPRMHRLAGHDAPAGNLVRLKRFLDRYSSILVLTGAGLSTASGIPAYRDADGQWLRRDPILYQDFMRCGTTRRRYWARSFLGWPRIRTGRPNGAHRALAELERQNRVSMLVTQNVDGLHRMAGSRALIELHGRLSKVGCLSCQMRIERDELQTELTSLNPDWTPEVHEYRPDGDAELDERAYPGFRTADCRQCGGILKPEVVFFGESVPAERSQAINEALSQSDAVLVVGSSLVVMSSYRIVRQARSMDLPVAAINNGRTRADDLLDFKVGGDCVSVLETCIAGAGEPSTGP